MRNALIMATLAALATGCGGTEEIWILRISPPADPVNTQTVGHNFNGAQPIAGTTTTTEWTETNTTVASPSIVFAQIVKVGGGDTDAFLIVDDIAVPGTRSGGLWTFTWNDTYQNTDREQHNATGYFHETLTDQTSTTSITGEFSGGSFIGGSMTSVSTSTTTWSQTDTWDATTVGYYSSYPPASSYLEFPDGTGPSNDYQLSDCAQSPCFLTVTNETSQTSTFTGERTKYTDESVFNAVEDATDPGN